MSELEIDELVSVLKVSRRTKIKYRNGFIKYNVKYIKQRVRRLGNMCERTIKGYTKYKLLLLYGKTECLNRWTKYCERQAYTNSKEYKNMTDEEFRRYNLSRAVTKDNLIKRWGDSEGLVKWNKYVERQQYTKSLQRYLDEFGECGYTIFKNINGRKAVTLSNFITKYGEEEGTRRFNNFTNTAKTHYSNKASKIFEEIDTNINYKCYYQPKTREMCIYGLDRVYFYDFYIPEIKLVIEFNGDLFHANPKMYNETNFIFPFDKTRTLNEIHKRDFDKINLIKEKYNIIILWESYFDKNKDIVNEIIYNINNNRIKKFQEYNI